METIRIQTGATERIVALALNGSLVPLTGLTDLVIAIQRVSDGQWFDWNDLTFKAAGWTTRQLAMTEISASLAPGQYRTDFVTSTITNPTADDAYLITVTQTPGTTVKNVPQVGELKVGQYVDDVPEILADTAAIDARLPSDPADESVQLAAHAQTQADIAALNDLSQADVQSAMTAQGYTAARAPNLDNLDATVSSRAAPGAAMDLVTNAVDAAALAADAVAEIDSALSSAHGAGSWEGGTPAAIADAVWDEAKAGHVAVGSFGEEVQGHATPAEVLTEVGNGLTAYGAATGAQVATRAAPGDAMDLVTDAVDAAALAADAVAEIDAALSAAHGAGAWDGVAPAQSIRDAMKLAPSPGAPAVGSIDEALDNIEADTAAIEPLVTTNLDAAVSSRAAPGAAMALTPAERAAVDAQLSGTHGAGSWEGSGAGAVAAAVWDEPKVGHFLPGTFGEELQIKPSATEVAGAVWAAPIPGGHPANSAGERLGATDDRVDVAVSSRAAPGAAMTLTAGERIAVGAQADTQLSGTHGAGSWEGPALGAVADAVWDEPIAGHGAAGSAGAELQAKAEPADVLTQAGAALVAYGATTPADLAGIPAAVDAELSGTHGAGSWEAPSAAMVAGQVWDEAKAGHSAPGSFGEEVQTHATPSEVRAQAVLALGDYDAADGADILAIPADVDAQLSAVHGAGSWEGAAPAAVADAVWDEALAGHAAPGSAGAALESARADAAAPEGRVPADPTSTATEALAHGVTQAAVAAVQADTTELLARLSLARAAALDSLPTVASDAMLVRQILMNRLELADGAVGNWILYADDDVTPLLTFAVTDKDGDPIRLAKWVPARRTRGT